MNMKVGNPFGGGQPKFSSEPEEIDGWRVDGLLKLSTSQLAQSLTDLQIEPAEAQKVLSAYNKAIANAHQDPQIQAIAAKAPDVNAFMDGTDRQIAELDVKLAAAEIRTHVLGGLENKLQALDDAYQKADSKISGKLADVKSKKDLHLNAADSFSGLMREATQKATTKEEKQALGEQVTRKAGETARTWKALIDAEKQASINAASLRESGLKEQIKDDKQILTVMRQASDFQRSHDFISRETLALGRQVETARSPADLEECRKAVLDLNAKKEALLDKVEVSTQEFEARDIELRADGRKKTSKGTEAQESVPLEERLQHHENNRRQLSIDKGIAESAKTNLESVAMKLQVMRGRFSPEVSRDHFLSHDGDSSHSYEEPGIHDDEFTRAMKQAAEDKKWEDRKGIIKKVGGAIGGAISDAFFKKDPEAEEKTRGVNLDDDSTPGKSIKNLEKLGNLMTSSPVKALKSALSPKIEIPAAVRPTMSAPSSPQESPLSSPKSTQSTPLPQRPTHHLNRSQSAPGQLERPPSPYANASLATEKLQPGQTINDISEMPPNQLNDARVHDTLKGQPDQYAVTRRNNRNARIYVVAGEPGQFQKDAPISIERRTENNKTTHTMKPAVLEQKQETGAAIKRGKSL